MATLDALRQTPHLSVSALKLFLQCPRNYVQARFMRSRRWPDASPTASGTRDAAHNPVYSDRSQSMRPLSFCQDGGPAAGGVTAAFSNACRFIVRSAWA